ncbi:MAG: DUF3971 domain-containing protein, partial [Pseudomonadota bacterium]
EVPNAEIAFHGPVKAYPFEGGEGEFRTRLDVKDIEFDYANTFPRAQGITGEVVITNVRLVGKGTKGAVLGNTLRELDVVIEDLRQGILQYDGATEGDVEAVLAYMRGTPYADQVGLVQAAAGPARVDLDFTLPLRKREDAVLAARLSTENAKLRLVGLPTSFTEVQGVVSYETNEGLVANGVEAMLLDRPVGINVVPVLDDNGSMVTSRLEVDGRYRLSDIIAPLDETLADYFRGTSRFVASAVLPVDSEEISGVSIATDLEGTQLTLPAPLAKAREETLATVVNLRHTADDGFAIDWRVGEVLSGLAQGRSDDAEMALTRAVVHFGSDDDAQSAFDDELAGVAIDGAIS